MSTVFFAGVSGRGVKVTDFVNQVPKMEWVELYLNSPYTPSCRGEGTFLSFLFLPFYVFLSFAYQQ
jgi:hypothetical protein